MLKRSFALTPNRTNRVMTLFKVSRVTMRYLGILSPKLQTTKVNDGAGGNTKDFVPIYKFPYIRTMSVVNKLKIYQTFLTAVAIPGSTILNQMDLLDQEAIYLSCALGFSGCTVLYSFGFLCSKFIGFIYVNEEKNVAKVSYVDFWGRRKDDIVAIEDIVPLSDLQTNFTDGVFLKFTRFSSPKTLRLNLTHGVVLDKTKFNKLFM